jgi:class 3 adenylate cyclase/ActR/RegA family two-component response regulator
MLKSKLQQRLPIPAETFRSHGFVLVVDDEEQNRTLLRDPLEARGYEIAEAENGMQALRKIALRPPDAILLDLMMPEMDGLEVCRHLRRDIRTAHIPVLIITALSARGDRLLGIQAGANDFLNKPIDLQEVILRVGNAVYAKHLHDGLIAEQAKSEGLLLNILPKLVAERMKKGEINIAENHPDVTVLVADLVGFASLSSHIEPEQVVLLLNEIFSAFDLLVERHRLEKIKTVGDSYMVAGGIFSLRPDHPEAVAALAIDLREEIERFNEQNGTSIRLRMGICTGPVVSGVIGRQKFAYDVWGETVNLAYRMESTGKAGRIQISESTRERLKDKFHLDRNRASPADGQNDPPAYWLGDPLEHPGVNRMKGIIAA